MVSFEWITPVLLAIVTGVFSVITIKVQRGQDKVINQIDERTVFMEKEKSIKQEKMKIEDKKDAIMKEIIILLLESDMALLKNTAPDEDFTRKLVTKSESLMKSYNDIESEMIDINKKWDLLLSMSDSFNRSSKNNE